MIARIFIFCALLAVTFAGVPTHAAEALFPLGSRMGFVPPPGFAISTRFPGFEHATGASILIVSMPPQAYAEVEATMTTEAAKQQGITEDKRETLKLPNGKGLLVAGMAQENGQKFRKLMFLGQISEGAALAAVRIPESAIKTISDDVLRTSLLTLAIRPSVPIEELLALMPFKVTELSGMRLSRVLGPTGVVLTDGPSDTPGPSEQPVFFVMIGQGGPEPAAERATFARNMFTGFSDFKELRILSGDMLRLGGGSQQTYELQAEAKEIWSGTPMKLVQWVRFGSGVFIRMVGFVRADQWSAAFPRFRAVRDGVAPRE